MKAKAKAYTLTVETRKAEWTGNRATGFHIRPGRNTWVARVTGRGRDSFEFLDIPVLPRGVRQGQVAIQLAPGLYRVDDRAGVKGAILVDKDCNGRFLSDVEYQIALSDVNGATGDPGGLSEQAAGPCLYLDVSPLGKVCRLTGLDRRYLFARDWNLVKTRVPGGMGKRRYRIEFNGLYEVREPEGVVIWRVDQDGNCEQLTRESAVGWFAVECAA